jgi:tetratricopeptide (TPR) repeat protein
VIASAIGAAVTVAWRRGHRGPAVLAATFVACVFPALGFINVYPFRFSYVADHFAYVSTTALAIASGWGLARVAERWPAIAGGWRGKTGAAILLGSFALLSMAQTTAYRDEETLWRRSLAVNPRAWMPASNLAGVLLVQAVAAGRAGDEAKVAALATEAEAFARQAIELYPSTFTAWMKLAESLRMQGKLAEALVAARESLRLEPRIPDTHWVIGRLLELQGDREGAIESYRQSVTLPEATRYDVVDVGSVITRRRDYARLLTLAGRDAEAAPAWERLSELTPDDPVIHGNIGMAYERMGEWPKARAAYQGAVARMDLSRPDQQTLVMQVLPRLVNALLMPPSGPEEADDALTGARWLVERTGRADALALLLLARAEKASGLSSANATYAEASQKAADPLLPEALREEIRRFAATFANESPPTR